MDIFFIIIAYAGYILIQLGWLGIPMHTDCGELRYPGFFFARKQIDYPEFAHKTGLFGNKIILYYYHLLSYRLLPGQPLIAPKLFFIAYNLLSATVLWATLIHMVPAGSAAFIVGLFLTATSYHRFFVCFDSVEKYGLLPVFLLVYFATVKPAYYGFWIGLTAPVLFFFFKPTYIFEWTAAAGYTVYHHPDVLPAVGLGVSTGLVLSILMAYTRFGNHFWDLRGLVIPNAGLYTYWLKFRRLTDFRPHRQKHPQSSDPYDTEPSKTPASKKTAIRNLSLFARTAAPGLVMVGLCAVSSCFAAPHTHDSLFLFVFLGALAGLALQFRFYGYQFLPLIPGALLLFSSMYHEPESSPAVTIIAVVAWVVLLGSIIRFSLKDPNRQASIVLKDIPHYRNRCLAAPLIAERIKPEKSDWLLQWGDSPQVNLLTGIPSPAGNEGTTPWNWLLFEDKARQAFEKIITTHPRFLVTMIDNLNLSVFEQVTGFRYENVGIVPVGNEAFKIYRLAEQCGRPTAVSDDIKHAIFLSCRKQTPEGRWVWNAIEDTAGRTE